MTTQLWMWEYNGQDEVGIKSVVDKQELFRTDDFYSLANQHSRRTIGQVTNLHKVKAVDEDAVVIEKDVIHFDKFLNEVIEVSGSNYDFDYTKSQKVHECAMYLQYKIYPTPPVTEPTGFGAIVEAQVSEINKPQRLVHSGHGFWILEGGTERSFTWDRLTNPVVISKGVSNGLR